MPNSRLVQKKEITVVTSFRKVYSPCWPCHVYASCAHGHCRARKRSCPHFSAGRIKGSLVTGLIRAVLQVLIRAVARSWLLRCEPWRRCVLPWCHKIHGCCSYSGFTVSSWLYILLFLYSIFAACCWSIEPARGCCKSGKNKIQK